MGECCMADYESLLRDKELGNKLRDKKRSAYLINTSSFLSQTYVHVMIPLSCLGSEIFRSHFIN